MGVKRSAAEARNGTSQKPTSPAKATHSAKKKDNVKHGKQEAKKLIFEARPDWHAAELPKLPIAENAKPAPNAAVEALRQHAVKLLEAENTAYDASHLSSSSSHKFMSTIMSSGTLEDKVSALTLLVQESPLHTMKAFENLLGIAKKRSRNHALIALGALKDLLGQGVVLPSNRKLRAFAKQPGLVSALQGKKISWNPGEKLPGSIEKIHLLSWAFEDWLKRTYFELLKALELWCNDEVEYARSRATTFVWELLKEKPEQEENLLRLLINKLGDTDKKIASRASHLLLQLQVTHPAMAGTVINAIESELLFRPGQSAHAKYYAIITLNQTILNPRDQHVANKLLGIYFGLFINLLKLQKSANATNGIADQKQGGGGKAGRKAMKKARARELADQAVEELNEKMIAQVLTGVNRAFPYADTSDAVFEKHLDTIFRVTHSSNFNTSVQALMLIQQISAAKQYSTDRFYRTLYESLLDPRLLTSSKQIMYLNLLYKSIKADVEIRRVKSFVKRLLQIITIHEPPFACGILYLISELKTTFPSIKSMLSQPEERVEEEEERFVDVPEEGEDGAPPNQPTSLPSSTANTYDPRKRDPQYANAHLACLWELLPLSIHYHPSISLFASHLLTSEPMPSKPDPTSHTLIHFLDRFAYRNARSKAFVSRGASIMQPLAGADTADLLIRSRAARRGEEINSDAFWRKKVEDVKEDEVFFHDYFQKAGKTRPRKQTRKKDADGEASEDNEGEEEIWKALVDSRPELEGADEDDELDDLMSGDDGSEDEVEGLEELLKDDDEDEDASAGSSDNGFDAAELESGDEAFAASEDEVPADFDAMLPLDEDRASTRDSQPLPKEEGRKKRRKLKHLPTFASADDYAKLLDDDEE